MKPTNISAVRVLVAAAALLISIPSQTQADMVWESNFEVTGGLSGSQYQTSNTVWAFSDITDWDKAGVNAAHALQRDGTDWALMIYSGDNPSNGNVYTQGIGFAANTLGVTYWVAFDIGATVWASAVQASTSSSLLRFTVIDGSDDVVASQDFAPGAWEGVQVFRQEYYSYIGTGTGPVRLQLSAGDAGSNSFSGAINNVSIWNSQPVPEPSSVALFLGGGLALFLARRKKN